MTTIEALLFHAPDVLHIVVMDDALRAQLQAAMKHYAEDKARHYARFFYDAEYFYSLRHEPSDWDAYTQEHPLE